MVEREKREWEGDLAECVTRIQANAQGTYGMRNGLCLREVK